MKGSEFVQIYGSKGLAAWEAAAVALVESGENVTWPFVEISLSDGNNTAVVKAMTDVFAVGEPGDFVRLPLTPGTAQRIANINGYMLPSPWLTYQRWRASPIKLTPTPMAPNLGANMAQWKAHNDVVQAQVDASPAKGPNVLISGHKKTVVVSNLYQNGKVLIFGWYKPMPPFPDVFDDGTPMTNPKRQPTQPESNVHGSWYLDYSHGIEFFYPYIKYNGQDVLLAEAYQDPVMSKLVVERRSGPLKTPRYPAPNTPANVKPQLVAQRPAAISVVPTVPGYADAGLAKVANDYMAKR